MASAFVLASTAAQAGKEAYVTAGVGAFDFMDSDHRSVEYRLEYRGKDFYNNFFPMVGINNNWDSGAYGFVGVGYDYKVTDSVYVIPSFGAGVYNRGSSKKLGGPLEFRSSLEAGVELKNKARVGIAISHMSNAGIYERNPGEESLTLNISAPFSMMNRNK